MDRPDSQEGGKLGSGDNEAAAMMTARGWSKGAAGIKSQSDERGIGRLDPRHVYATVRGMVRGQELVVSLPADGTQMG